MAERFPGWSRRGAVTKACYESIAFLERTLYDYDEKDKVMHHYKKLASATCDWSENEIDRIIDDHPQIFAGVKPKETTNNG